ncbi:hypothetical protein, partial [Acetobacter sp.]|uniref:hypothetical protein n=1 Tax=Acetobacter sp. TaxID=440 RepID=UPI0039EA51B2
NKKKTNIERLRQLSSPGQPDDEGEVQPLSIDEIDAAIWILLEMRRRNPDVTFGNAMALLRMVRRMVWDVEGLSAQKLKVIYPRRFMVNAVRRMFGKSFEHYMRDVKIDREM